MQFGAESGFHVAGQIEVDEAVGGADLNLGVGVPGGFYQRIETALRANVDDGFDGFNAFPNLINSPFRMGNGLCNFAEGSGIPSSSMR